MQYCNSFKGILRISSNIIYGQDKIILCLAATHAFIFNKLRQAFFDQISAWVSKFLPAFFTSFIYQYKF